MPVAAEKKPIVPMNSFTGIPLSTWTFLNTSSAIGPAWPRAVAVPSRDTAAMAAAVRIACLLPGIHRLLRQRLGNQFIQLHVRVEFHRLLIILRGETNNHQPEIDPVRLGLDSTRLRHQVPGDCNQCKKES